ncbi:MAG: TolC family protein [Bacteroidota bacterium]
MKYINMLLLSLIALGLYAQQQTEPKTFSLKDAVSYAKSNNYALKNGKLDVKASEQKVKEILASGLPQINASGTYNHNIQIPVQVFPNFINGALPPGSPKGPETIEAKFGFPHSATGSITANQLLFDGGFLMGVKASKEFVNLSRLNLNRSEIETELAVSSAYFLALLYNADLEKLNKNIETQQKLLSEKESLAKSGLADKIESDRVKLQTSSLMLQRDQKVDAQKIALMVLKLQMGMRVTDSIVLSDNLESLYEAKSKAGLEANVSYENRVEYKQLMQSVKLNEYNKKRYQYQYAPNLSAFITHQRNSFGDQFGQLGKTWYPGTIWGLSLNIPVFDGFRKQAQIQQVKIDLMKNENDIANFQTMIENEVYQAKMNFKRTSEQLEIQKGNLQLAEDIYSNTNLKTKNGLGSSLELSLAQKDLDDARNAYFGLIYSYFVSDLELQKALGNIK